MKQGRSALAFALAAALAAAVLAPAAEAAKTPATSQAAPAASSTKKNTLRQFTGYVTTVDKNSITVEKRGKKPQTRVFTRDAETKTTGEVGKDAHVTVYYRDENGRAVARRVVVKEADGEEG
jgi:hypothetical protein